MRYERPRIIRRDRIAGLLDIIKSDGDAAPSDVNLKENFVPVVWSEPSRAGVELGAGVQYESPAIVRRDRIAGLLDIAKSDGDAAPSDVNLKENFVPVAW